MHQKRVYGYLRSATEGPEADSFIELQNETIQSYCDMKEWELVKVYTDKGCSGNDLDRPAIQEMINEIKKGTVDTVLVCSLDRLSRRGTNIISIVDEVFEKNNVTLVSIKDDFDTSATFSRFQLYAIEELAKKYKEDTKIIMEIHKRGKAQ